MTRSCLYAGEVMHRRLRPFRHRFRYRVFSLLLDLDELPELGRRLALFSHNRFNLASFHDRDHGARDGSPLRPWVELQLARHGLPTGGAIRLLCFPRILGYVFNPLSVYFCYNPGGRLTAILYDVRNTFGDKHGYLIETDPAAPVGAPVRQRCAKTFHVSPFLPLAGTYRFRLKEPDETLSILIAQSIDDADMLIAAQTGRRQPLDDAGLAGNLLRHPLMTVKVIAAIHWQALRLWRKGAAFHRHPGHGPEEVTFVPAAARRQPA